MTISLPISLASYVPSRISFYPDPRNRYAISESPFTGHSQVFQWDNGLWMCDVTFAPKARADRQALIEIIESLYHSGETITIGPKLLKTPLGAGGGTPKVKGASQIDYTLDVDGFPNSTLVLAAGDYLGVGSSLYRNRSNATTNASGEVTLDIWPNARNHADNSDLNLTAPVCIMRIVDTAGGAEEIADRVYSCGFTAREAK